ncbi:type IV toxin-antitoxin system AbiEi family antitoxin domain-containing protein [Nocardioides sp.]|uniref:type IV toxin-antitoxin system AbiEi family antitoxin domain-containing protein n=1 Tax=Nocardioides sp. TaxID=35761 RepID=UPI002732729E|nr:type IV toxin-antitoxin system AbiEi family antitoxin domain-containing protein [Nocardioides sp.]MDP3891950.1 type IV toxin-antitoxin system AbiEi family antitoxin domain-containing protein [Nocardioides sp.]
MDARLRQVCADHGVFLRREALALGYDDRTIRRLVRAGVWVRVRQGAYTFADMWTPMTAEGHYGVRGRAVRRAAKVPVVLSHTSSLQERGATYWDLDLNDVHLTRTDGRTGRREAGVRQHQGRLLDGDVEMVNGVAITSATRSALEITTIADVERSLVVVNDLLHKKQTSMDALCRRYELMRGSPDTLATELILRLADSRIESVGESRTFYLCWRAGLPAPEPQFDILDRFGRLVGTVDFAWPEHGVFLEFDGKVKYTRLLREGESPADAVVREKRRQDRISELTGWTCIRLDWADLHHPGRTAARIRQVLTGAAAA